MIDVQNVNLNNVPKKFLDGAIGAYGKNIFMVSFTLGNMADSYATIPPVMKDVARFLSKLVEEYEKAYGPIDMAIPEVISPFKFDDFKKPPEGDNKK